MAASPSPPHRVAVLLAGGTGTRTGLDRPKQLAELGGASILDHSLRALHDHPDVDEVVVVMAADHLAAARELAAARPKVSVVLPGGVTRTESTLVALAHLGETECHLLIHDAARPLVTARVITDCLTALGTYAAVATVVPVTDTVFEVGPDGLVRDTLDRATLRRVQTPQGFRSEVLREAYARAAQDPDFAATDDCGVVMRYLPDQPVAVVAGDERNLKVTTPVDLEVVAALLATDGP